MQCPNCGAENAATNHTCVRCGRFLLTPNAPRQPVATQLQSLRPSAGQPSLVLLLGLALLTLLLMAFVAQWGLRQAASRPAPDQQALAVPTQSGRVQAPNGASPMPGALVDGGAWLPRLTLLPTEAPVTATPQPAAQPTSIPPTAPPPPEPTAAPLIVAPTEPPSPPGPTAPPPTSVPALPTPVPPSPTAPPPPTTAAGGLVRPGPTLTAGRVAAPPVIDGHLNEWTTDGAPVNAVVYGAENWAGPADLSGQVWFGWADQALYIAARVVDDVLSQSSRGSSLYLGDSVEIQWDTDLAGDFNVNEFNADDWHIGISPGNFEGLPPEVYIWTPQAQSGEAAGIRYASRLLGTRTAFQGYNVEVAIPWTLVKVTPSAGLAFGLTFAISDNDRATPVQQTMLATTPYRQWHRPLTFNTLTLAPN